MAFLRTPRLVFRHWSPDDLDLAVALWCDPDVSRLFASEPVSEEEAHRRLRKEIASQERHGVQYWPCWLRSPDALDAKDVTSELVGCCGLTPRPPDSGPAPYELGFHLRPAYWGRGLATEAARAVVTYAFAVLAAPALFAGHHPDNAASARVLTKLGFEPIAPERFAGTGLLHPSYLLRRGARGAAATERR